MCPKYYYPLLVRKDSVDFTDNGEHQTEYTWTQWDALKNNKS